MNCISATCAMAADLALNRTLEQNVVVSSGLIQHFAPEHDIGCNDGCNVVRTTFDDSARLLAQRLDTAAIGLEAIVCDLRPTLHFLEEAFTHLRDGRVVPSVSWR